MSYSETVTKEDLKNVLNEVLPSPMMIQTKQYTSTITWSSTSNPFGDVYTDIEIDGWTPINLSYLVGGSLSSFVFGSQIEIKESNGTTYAHGYFRMTGATPSSTTQNSVTWTVVYIKNAPMTLPIADYIVEQGTSGIWTYRKWNSGVAECWGKDTQQTKVNNAWGSMYVSTTFTVSFPTDLFNAPPVTQIYASGGYLCLINNGNSTPTKDVATYGLFRATSVSTTETYYAHIHAKGTWK